MRSENYVYFFTVSGFFISLIFSILKSSNAYEFIIFVIGITAFFYLFIHLVLIFFFNIDPKIQDSFNKQDVEEIINYQISQLKEKELAIEKLTQSLKSLKG